ncbi:WD40 repeat-like protein [Sodiomyces alkalinus F11]|uniref:WD40 repeat-like protein n=1 Tax=Sodiomyces alkalinus (strain CBS 110278 / VKM F-3762 / F11) TaxID=1314773 RepID=A0A3N2PYW0_SODAK|nr:WD40 repeat-like protein [Sodiomyces alkalinus F11]ROT39710.1 WD40 repeat-like protein [Sodiomyces alkalinus F11]
MNSDEDLSDSENGGVPLSYHHHLQPPHAYVAVPLPSSSPVHSAGSPAGTVFSNHTLYPNPLPYHTAPSVSPLASNVAGADGGDVIAPSSIVYTYYPTHYGWYHSQGAPAAESAAGDHDDLPQGDFDVPLPPLDETIPPLEANGDDDFGEDPGTQIFLGSPQPNSLAPQNSPLDHFLKFWAATAACFGSAGRMKAPWLSQVNEQLSEPCRRVTLEQLCGDERDVQGLNWAGMGITRLDARERRLLTYKNYTNKPGSDDYQHLAGWAIRSSESHFKFRRMDIRRNTHLAHFQLRNVLACSGRSHAFYPGLRAVYRMNLLSGHTEVAMDLSDMVNGLVSTLDAKCGVVIAGTSNGEYCMRNTYSQDSKFVDGQITSSSSAITNHLQIHESRTSDGPLVAFASNDQGFRVMDVQTQKFLLDTAYSFPLNCTALSTDRRLRVLVGDSHNVLIASADTGEILQELCGHRDYGFACAWSGDGWTVATAAQDKTVMIWDARRWTDSNGASTPLTTVQCEMAGARSLRFSPIGSGPPVLVAAEEADYVNIINAKTFRGKQTFDIFGEIGGVAFTNDGQDLDVLCMDPSRGGIIQLERCNLGSKSNDRGDEFPFRAVPWWARRRQDDDQAWSMSGYRAEASSRFEESPPHPRSRVYLDDMEPF